MGSMGLVKPTNHGSADVWDVILSTLFDLVEEHDHTTGKGVKIPSAALRVNADVPWSDSGTSYAITGAKAFDFTASAPAGMTSYAGALFLSDGTSGTTANELYWRTTGGTNVQLTSGASLNVTAFVGGIGGDYSSISALVDYDDASDTYRFRQQTSAGVRQFAKMSAADVRLFEYFAAGASPVPTNSVTLKSPATLAASYSMIMPAALPTATSPMMLDNSGNVSAPGTLRYGVKITPAQLVGAAVNDYNPAGLSSALVLVQDCGAGATINGLVGGVDGRVLVIVNSNASATLSSLVLAHEAAGSTAANRIVLANATNLTIRYHGAVMLWYDGAASRWRVMGANV